jgi:predicted phage terminase large subunit-like protein
MFLGNIAREFRENEDLKQTFGVKRLAKDNETELIIQWNDGELTRLSAHGAQQKIRGTNWRGIRPDLIICDDLENDEAVLNDDRRDKFLEWFLQTLIPIGGKKALIRVVGTILHEDSLLAGLMPDMLEDRQCVDTPLRVTTTKPGAWISALYRAHPDFDDFSEILWPEGWDEDRLKLRRQAYIDAGKPEGYAQEYLNNPMAKEGAYFQPEDLIPILPEELNPESKSPEHFVIAADLAISKERQRAYTVFIIAGIDPAGTLRIREVVRKRMDSLEIMDEFFHLHQKYKWKSAMKEDPIFLVEAENIAKSIGPVLDKNMEERGLFLTIESMPPIRDKLLRGRSIQARIRQHRVEFWHEAPWFPTLAHELCTFPRSTYKDQVDALAWIGYYIATIYNAPTPQEMADDLYEEEWEEAEHHWGGGANSITGY